MRIAILLATLSLVACQSSSSSLAHGDSLYRKGLLHQALEAWEASGNPESDPELAARIERGRFAIRVYDARKLLNNNEPADALARIDSCLAEQPDHHEAFVIRQRCLDKLSSIAAAEGRAHLESERFDEALAAYEQALKWNPNNEVALEYHQLTIDKSARHKEYAESVYFDGLNFLRNEKELQAFTVLQHAAKLMGEGSRADERIQQLAASMAEASRTLGLRLLEEGRTGPAWLAFTDAVRLAPDDKETLKLLQDLEERVLVGDLLLMADMAVRSGEPSAANQALAQLEGKTNPQEAALVAELKESVSDLQIQLDYRFARALEMDTQLVRASALYASILEQQAFADVALRHQVILESLAKANSLYAAAQAAEEVGDLETAQTLYSEVAAIAFDFQDAAQRAKTLAASPSEAELE